MISVGRSFLVHYSKWLTVIVGTVIIGLTLWNRERITDWIAYGDSSNLPVVFLFVVLLALIPGVPFGIIGGIIGAKYGMVWGSVINIVASTIAAAIFYYLSRYLFQAWGMALLVKSEAFQRWNKYIKDREFWSILFARIIPVVPAVLINLYAGVFRLSIKPFLLATLLGKIPVMFVFAYVGDNIWSGARQWIGVLITYTFFLLIVYCIYRLYTKQRAN